jgi:hypothetical protein
MTDILHHLLQTRLYLPGQVQRIGLHELAESDGASEIRHFTAFRSNANESRVKAYAGIMDYTSQHLNNLRQEIVELQHMNVLYLQRGAHSPGEKTASEGRASRLIQIKQELTRMRDRPNSPAVWWEKFRESGRSI